MQALSLDSSDFSEQEYDLFAIHSYAEDYHLAYQLNKCLNLKLKREKEGFSISKKGLDFTFSMFEFEDLIFDVRWRLIANKTKIVQKTGIFEHTEGIQFLLKQFKKVDYFLVVEDGYTTDLVLKSINYLSVIITSYKIETKTLKSQDLLIF